jgi:hypothetical protein
MVAGELVVLPAGGEGDTFAPEAQYRKIADATTTNELMMVD